MFEFYSNFVVGQKRRKNVKKTKPIFEGLYMYLGNTWHNLVKIWIVGYLMVEDVSIEKIT